MRLAQPFYRLNVCFDADRLQAEVAALPITAWANHPNDVEGNDSVRLLSVDGQENDAVDGRMAMTPHLLQSAYMRQILASFGVVWGRSRLMRLAPGASVPQHADINYHWFTRVRLHIPVTTRPEVRFYCDTQSVHMAAGEAWIFDNWRQHRVENPTEFERIHLVADTTGSSSFWQFVATSQSPDAVDHQHRYDATRDAQVLTEQAFLAPIMPPAEVDMLIADLRAEITSQYESADGSLQLARYHALLDGFCKDWRQLYLLHGSGEAGRPAFTQLRDSLRMASKDLATHLLIRSNRVAAHMVLEARVLRPMLAAAAAAPIVATPAAAARHSVASTDRPTAIWRPIFIVAAPRSGSTLLFETLAASEHLVTVGGEAHWLVEGIEELRAGAPGIESNRLTAESYSPAVADRMQKMLAAHLVDHAGRRISAFDNRYFLEKTPKNSLRIPLFNRIFPDARFIFLWRDPRENLSSIMEAWRSGKWKTYNGLDGFDGPWSLILPPGWRAQNGRPPEEIAAFQWNSTNRIILEDLDSLPRQRWATVSYAELIADPRQTIARLSRFIGIEMDPSLVARLSAPLPHSRFTHTPPADDKWQVNAAQIERVLPGVLDTWHRLRALR